MAYKALLTFKVKKHVEALQSPAMPFYTLTMGILSGYAGSYSEGLSVYSPRGA
jgi:hypothetical protein